MPKTATKRPLSDAEKAKRRKDALGVLDYPSRALAQGKALYAAGKGIITEGLGSLIAGAEYAGDRSVTKEVPKDINRLGKMVAQNAGGYADAGNALWQMVKGDGKQAVPDYYRNKVGQAYQEQFNPSPADPRLERFGNFYADPAAVALGAGRAARGVADPKLWRGIAEDMAQGAQSNVIRRYGIPEDAGEIISGYDETPIMLDHPSYRNAKGGSADAGFRIAKDLIPPSLLNRVERTAESNSVLVPMYSPERSGYNKIPIGMAAYISERTGIPLTPNIVQSSTVGHTGAGAMDRMVARPLFGGKVDNGQSHILVDDVITLGGTMGEASNYIQSLGGDVGGIISLINKSKGDRINPSEGLVKDIRNRFGNAPEEEFGIVPEALTRPEAEYLARFGSANNLRNRAASARAKKGS